MTAEQSSKSRGEKIKVRTHPVGVFYLTGEFAARAREAAPGERSAMPCFTTEECGENGFVWETCEEFEADYRMSFPEGGLGK